MTRTISLIIGVGLTALAVAVPTALSEGRLAGSSPQGAGSYSRANELATLVQPVQLDRRTDAWGRTQPTPQASAYRDAGVRTIRPVDYGIGQYVDGNQRGTVPTGTVAEPVSGPGTYLDWQQLGIGLGLGIALAFGLMLMFRATGRERPLAH